MGGRAVPLFPGPPQTAQFGQTVPGALARVGAGAGLAPGLFVGEDSECQESRELGSSAELFSRGGRGSLWAVWAGRGIPVLGPGCGRQGRGAVRGARGCSSLEPQRG